MTDALDSPALRFCWCPPMQDPNDPNQHEAACAHAAFVAQIRQHQKPTAGCYQASFGWVHVKPGCHCVR